MAEHHSEDSVDVSSPIQVPFLQLPESESRVSSYLPLMPNQNRRFTFIGASIMICLIVILYVWILGVASVGIYGNSNLELGPNCSILIKPNPFFVDHIKVEQLRSKGVQGEMLYGFYEVPPLDVVTQWSESHSARLAPDHRMDLIYFFNEGSQINISYSVNSSSLILAIAQVSISDVANWIQHISHPSATLSWNTIRGTGMIQHDFKKSSTYYIGIINWSLEAVEVNLNLDIKNILYDTSDAYFKCTLAQGECNLKTFFPKGNFAVLTTPVLEEGMSFDEWSVKLFYAPRWSTCLLGLGGMSLLMLVAVHLIAKSIYLAGEMRRPATGVSILSHTDEDDVSYWGSSYDSGSQDDDDLEDGPLIDGEFDINTHRLCVICFDSPRDSFFLPCGHCAVCFACGTRIAEALESCPICKRRIKKVRKIYTS